MSWRSKRQLTYVGGLLIVAIGFLAAITIPKLTVPPTCTDNKNNGDETGVDCGGSCQLYCEDQVSDLAIEWARVFPAGEGLYNIAVIGENRNFDAFIPKLEYTVMVYDKDNILIKEIPGTTFAMPNGEFAIFIANQEFSLREPKRVIFKVADTNKWLQFRKDRSSLPLVKDSGNVVSDWDTSPKLTSTLINEGFIPSLPMDVVAVVYDSDGNALQASKTFVDSIPAQSSRKIYFSWREPLSESPAQIKVIELPNYQTIQ